MASPRFITAAEEFNRDPNPVKVASLLLNNDQIKALPDTPVTLIEALGEGVMAVPLCVNVQWNLTAAYETLDGAILAVSFTGVNQSIATISEETWAIFTETGGDGLVASTPNNDGTTSGISFYGALSGNTTVVVKAYNTPTGTHFTGGDPDNWIKVQLIYVPVTL